MSTDYFVIAIIAILILAVIWAKLEIYLLNRRLQDVERLTRAFAHMSLIPERKS